MKKSIPLLITFIILASFTPHKQLTWMAIGDSITYLDAHPEAAKHRISKGYMTDVVEKLPYVSFVNNGHPGWTAKSIAARNAPGIRSRRRTAQSNSALPRCIARLVA